MQFQPHKGRMGMVCAILNYEKNDNIQVVSPAHS